MKLVTDKDGNIFISQLILHRTLPKLKMGNELLVSSLKHNQMNLLSLCLSYMVENGKGFSCHENMWLMFNNNINSMKNKVLPELLNFPRKRCLCDCILETL